MDSFDLFLASRSPRRLELLAQLGLRCRVLATDVDETPRAGEDASDYVTRLAAAKARLGREQADAPWPVLAADTAVVIDGKILGKPTSAADAAEMLARLSGRAHRVLTAVALSASGPDAPRVQLSESQVHFRLISPAEAAAYWSSGEPCDKAGGYGIQGLGAIFVERLIGSWSGVVGLPLFETAALLSQAGLQILAGGGARE